MLPGVSRSPTPVSDGEKLPNKFLRSVASASKLTALQSAREMVEFYLQLDRIHGSIYEPLERSSTTHSNDYQVLEDRNYEVPPVFIKRCFYPIPRDILEQLDSHQPSSIQIGVFSSIRYAWVAVETNLFLWNFVTGSDFVVYRDSKFPITKAEVVPCQPGVFVNDIKQLLVLVTTSTIALHGIVIDGNDSVQLRRTGFEVSFGSFPEPTHILGTAEGRIFLAGSDAQLYELKYDAEERWFSKRNCNLNDCTGNWLRRLLPIRLRNDKITSVAYDSTRSLLYTVTGKHELHAYSLSTKSGAPGFQKVSISSDHLFSEACSLCPAFGKNFHSDASTFSLVSIHAISATEGKLFCLVAVTAEAVRLYFALQSGDLASKDWNLRLAHVRLPFEDPSTVRKQEARRFMHVLCTSGTFFAAFSSANGQKFGLLEGNFYSPRLFTPTNPLEQWSEVAVAEQPIAIVPFSAASAEKAAISKAIAERNNSWSGNDLQTQHITDSFECLFLSMSGIDIYRRIRPIDRLLLLVVEARGSLTEQLRTFFEAHPLDQMCCMGLILAGQLLSGMHQVVQQAGDVFMWLTSLLMRFGGENREIQLQASELSQPDIGLPKSDRLASFSGIYRGAALCVARYVRPIGQSMLSEFLIISSDDNSTEKLRFRSALLISISNLLRDLLEVFKKAKEFRSCSSTATILAPSRLQAQNNERLAFSAFFSFVERYIEALSFCQLVMDHLGNARIAPDLVSVLSCTTFDQFVTEERGIQVSRLLSQFIISREIRHERSIIALCEAIKSRCPGYFGNLDILFYQGMESLHRACITKSERERGEMELESMRLFMDGAEYLTHEMFQEICQSYSALHYYYGIARVTFAVSSVIDPKDEAYSYMRNGKQPAYLAELYEKRIRIYLVAFQYLGEMYERAKAASESEKQANSILGSIRNAFSAVADGAKSKRRVDWQVIVSQVQSACLKTQNSLFLWKYLEMCVLIKRQDLVMLCESNVCQEFLAQLFRTQLTDQIFDEQIDLLWNWQIRHRHVREAAKTLFTLATCSKTTLRLMKRIEYLAIALSATTSITSGSIEERDALKKELQDQIDVANVQLNVLNLFRNRKFSCAATEIEEVIRTLDGKVLDLTSLYNGYAKKYRLPEASLIILKTASFDNASVMISAWQEILDRDCSISDHKGFFTIKTTIAYLAPLLRPSEKAFPTAFLVASLAKIAFERNMQPEELVSTFLDASVSASQLFTEFERLFFGQRSVGGVWASETGRIFLVRSFTCLIEAAFAQSAVRESLLSIKGVGTVLSSLCTNCLTQLGGATHAQLMLELDLACKRLLKG